MRHVTEYMSTPHVLSVEVTENNRDDANSVEQLDQMTKNPLELLNASILIQTMKMST